MMIKVRPLLVNGLLQVDAVRIVADTPLSCTDLIVAGEANATEVARIRPFVMQSVLPDVISFLFVAFHFHLGCHVG